MSVKKIKSKNILQPHLKRCVKIARQSWQQRYDRHYHPSLKHGSKHLLADVVLLFGVIFMICLSAFTVFFYQVKPAQDMVLNIKIIPDRPESGSLASVVVEYENSSDYLLKDNVLIVKAPDIFKLVKAVPLEFNRLDSRLELKDIPAGGSGRLVLTYKVLSELASHHSFSASLQYSAAQNNKTDFYIYKNKQTISAVPVIIATQGALAVEPLIHKNLVQDSFYAAGLVLKNNSLLDMDEKIKVCIESSDNIQLRQWNDCRGISELSSGEEKYFPLNLTAVSNGDGWVGIKVFVVVDKRELLQVDLVKQVVIHPQTVKAEYQVNGENNGSIFFKQSFKVKGQITVEPSLFGRDLVLSVPLDLDRVDLASVQIPPEARLEENNIIYRFGASDFEKIGDKIDFEFDAQLKSPEQLQNQIQPVNYLAIYPRLNMGEQIIIVPPLFVPINTFVQLDSAVKFYTADGEQIGRGQFPPQVGDNTGYWVFFKLRNFFHPLREAHIVGYLGERAEWTARSTVGGKDDFYIERDNQNERRIIYYIGNLSTGSEQNNMAGLEIKITPSLSDRGEVLVMLDNIRLIGRDVFTGQIIYLPVEAVVSDEVK